MFDFRAALLHAHDGDTVTVLADLGFDARHEVDVRLLDVRAPELGQRGGAQVAQFVRDWLAAAARAQPTCRWPLYVTTVKTATAEPGQRRTFTRYLGELWRFEQRPGGERPGASLNDAVREHLAAHPDWGPGR